jgi:hypothetical protein
MKGGPAMAGIAEVTNSSSRSITGRGFVPETEKREREWPLTPLKVRAGVVLARPLSFERRSGRSDAMIEKDFDAVLAEINELLAI